MNKRRLLTIDIGNTAIKAAVFEGENQICSAVEFNEEESISTVAAMISDHRPEGICICCVGESRPNLDALIEKSGLPTLRLGPDTPLPMGVDYDRSTLGVDRIAAAAGVTEADEAVLVVDAGTAITIDLVADGRFRGGNISPGLKLRFRSLHAFTSRLPLVPPEGELPLFGHNTETAIRAGVVRGMAAEIAAAFDETRRTYPDIRLLLTGGDAELVEPFLRQYGLEPQADPQAVGRGLVRIFNHNIYRENAIL